MITVDREGSIAEGVINMLLAQDASPEDEKPIIIKIEENLIERIGLNDTHVSFFSLRNEGTGRIKSNLLPRDMVPVVIFVQYT